MHNVVMNGLNAVGASARLVMIILGVLGDDVVGAIIFDHDLTAGHRLEQICGAGNSSHKDGN